MNWSEMKCFPVGEMKHEYDVVWEELGRRNSFHFYKIENTEENVHEPYLNLSIVYTLFFFLFFSA